MYVEDGCIVGEEIFSPPWNRWEGRAEFVPLSRKKIFQILPDVEEAPEETDGANGKDKDKQPSIRCLIGSDETPELGCDGKLKPDGNFPIFLPKRDLHKGFTLPILGEYFTAIVHSIPPAAYLVFTLPKMFRYTA